MAKSTPHTTVISGNAVRNQGSVMSQSTEAKQYFCQICSHVYDEANGDPLGNAPPGTKWDQLPEAWVCPECGAPKDNFVELTQ